MQTYYFNCYTVTVETLEDGSIRVVIIGFAGMEPYGFTAGPGTPIYSVLLMVQAVLATLPPCPSV